jgi:hypothetical protein
VQLSPYQYSDHRARTRALWSHLGGKIFAGRVLRLVIPPPRLLGQNFPLFHFMELAAKNRRLENSWNPTHGCARGRSRWSLPPLRLLRRGDLTSEIWQFRSTREMRRVGLAADNRWARPAWRQSRRRGEPLYPKVGNRTHTLRIDTDSAEAGDDV